MNAEEMKQLVATAQWGQLETAWGAAIEGDCPLSGLAEVLEAVAAAGKSETADVLGWMLLTDRCDRAPAAEAIDAARAALSVSPDNAELREMAVELYRKAFPEHPHLEVILKASGLAGGQSPRRAFATLTTCLALQPGGHVVNRYDDRALEVVEFDSVMGEFKLADPRGETVFMEPKKLADDFDVAEESDFRVLLQHKGEDLKKLIASDPAAVLIGFCQAHGGRTNSTVLKSEMISRKLLTASEWSKWWTRARSACKKCPQLGLEGRNPVDIIYYPQGRSLEEELAREAAGAWSPLERLTVLTQYARQLQQRKETVNAEFAGPIVEAIAVQARSGKPQALAAAIAVRSAVELGMPAPGECPSPQDILAASAKPAEEVADLPDASFWPGALDVLQDREDAVEQLEKLLHLSAPEHLDDLAARLRALGAGEAVDRAAAEAVGDASAHRDLYLWLWRGPAEPPAQMPGPVEMLSRMLEMLQRIDHDGTMAAADRAASRQRIRSALSASDYAGYRRAVAEMNSGVAETFRDRIQRCVGLSETVREDMLSILRDAFYKLFVKEKVEPWLDEAALWTTEAALHKREDLLKEIIEIRMPENARAIGAAAEHGDLSENSEWKFAIEERDLLRARAAKLQMEIASARILHPEDVPTDHVGIGSRAHLTRDGDGLEAALTILGVWDSDLPNRVYSYKAAISAELLGKSVGDRVSLKLEDLAGDYTITAISNGLT